MHPAPALGPALFALALAAPTAPAAAPPGPPCPIGTQVLGAIGRATVVAFTGPVFGDRVCALAVNLAFDGYRAALAAGPGQAMIDAAVAPGTGAALTIAGDGTLRLAPGQVPDANPDALDVGPFVIAPGGAFAAPAGQTDAAPRVVLAYAGPRVLLLATSAVTLIDLARILQDQPDLFGIGAPERAVVLASGAGATLAIHAPAVTLGTPPATAQVVEMAPR
jgi:hypothetical protein